jgi:hypothetical protein
MPGLRFYGNPIRVFSRFHLSGYGVYQAQEMGEKLLTDALLTGFCGSLYFGMTSRAR